MSDPRFEQINELFINYSQGKFDYKVDVSSALDEIDTFIANINMLGEELKVTTISKNYFNTIFDSVSDMLFVLDNNGAVKSINRFVTTVTNFSETEVLGLPLSKLLKNQEIFEQLREGLNKNKNIANSETIFIAKGGENIPVNCTLNYLYSEVGQGAYILICHDIRQQKEMENLVIRTVVNTQENERKRFATDMHDSLGQQLSAIQFYIKTLASRNNDIDENTQQLVRKAMDGMANAIIELRNICFNLMPKSLENFGLRYAINELCKKIETKGTLDFDIYIKEELSPIEKPLEIVLFRIIQEFINNSIKHSNGKTIGITLSSEQNNLHLLLQDDGVGFDINNLSKDSGLGLRNVRARVASYNGEIKIISKLKQGTTYKIIIPLKQ